MTFTLYHGDCLEEMARIDAGSIDAVITDPPYGVGKATWDDAVPPVYVWKEVQRILKPRGSLIVFTGLKYMPETMRHIEGLLDYQWPFAWYKSNAMQFGKTGFSVLDLALWYGNGRATAVNKRRDVIEYPIIPSENNHGHPTPKPLRVMAHLLTCVTGEGQTILDPFMGSGTTGVACMNTGRNFIGIELEREYYDIAAQRIEKAANAARQLELL